MLGPAGPIAIAWPPPGLPLRVGRGGQCLLRDGAMPWVTYVLPGQMSCRVCMHLMNCQGGCRGRLGILGMPTLQQSLLHSTSVATHPFLLPNSEVWSPVDDGLGLWFQLSQLVAV